MAVQFLCSLLRYHPKLKPLTVNQGVVGSSPTSGAINQGVTVVLLQPLSLINKFVSYSHEAVRLILADASTASVDASRISSVPKQALVPNALRVMPYPREAPKDSHTPAEPEVIAPLMLVHRAS